MIFEVLHRTTIRYDAIVQLAQFNLRLQPVAWPGQDISDYRLTLTPRARVSTRQGPYLCNLTRASIEAPLARLVIESRFKAVVDRPVPHPEPEDPTIETLIADPMLAASLDAWAPANYLYPSPRVPFNQAIASWCGFDLHADRPIVAAGFDLARRIQQEFRFDASATEVDTPPSEAFAARNGVCQDFVHIMITGLRAAGIPAAYASGYIRTLPPPGQSRLIGADATHAWVLIWCGAARGWIGFDPTNAALAGSDYIVVAVGRDYSDVSPIDGMFVGGRGQRIDVEVDVVPLEAYSS